MPGIASREKQNFTLSNTIEEKKELYMNSTNNQGLINNSLNLNSEKSCFDNKISIKTITSTFKESEKKQNLDHFKTVDLATNKSSSPEEIQKCDDSLKYLSPQIKTYKVSREKREQMSKTKTGDTNFRSRKIINIKTTLKDVKVEEREINNSEMYQKTEFTITPWNKIQDRIFEKFNTIKKKAPLESEVLRKLPTKRKLFSKEEIKYEIRYLNYSRPSNLNAKLILRPTEIFWKKIRRAQSLLNYAKN